MCALLAFAFLLVLQVKSEQFDPTKFDYCDITCKEFDTTHKHSACNCHIDEGREEILDDIVQFRRDALDLHNKLRNYIASGLEKNANAGEAAKMMALNYDLELEYIARCSAGHIVTPPDKCVRHHGFNYSGQNVGGLDTKNVSGALFLIQEWYDEIMNIDNTVIDKFPESNFPKMVKHFAQMLWATQEYVGCARVWYPEHPDKNYRLMLVCNYASPEGPTNVPGQPVYEKGEKCTKCPEDTVCGTKYTALCGFINATPTDKPWPIEVKSTSVVATPLLALTLAAISLLSLMY